MSVGAGIAMIVFGLIFLAGVIEIDIPWINEYALGVLLALAGVLTLGLSLWGISRRGRVTTAVVERPAGAHAVERQVVERDLDDPNVL